LFSLTFWPVSRAGRPSSLFCFESSQGAAMGKDGNQDVGIRLGQTLTPEFGPWLENEIQTDRRSDIKVLSERSSQGQDGNLNSTFMELAVQLAGSASLATLLEPAVKPALEFLWGKLFEFLKGKPAESTPQIIQIVLADDVFEVDPSKMSATLPQALLDKLAELRHATS
jgi:hypothetical protein